MQENVVAIAMSTATIIGTFNSVYLEVTMSSISYFLGYPMVYTWFRR